ncbi:recombinase family protein [Paenibacillus sp. Soil522]|uniref:recombinase family protein n=1 Tax=Paenibacillus sp. Soil522 TaxID=1736388 RepID=UPI00070184E0|nr:recombinase family protein [Paenibacillus sp. Soil522]KRE45518.1 hypothetical protein ASG81_12965 [Paenibacillus sp. Soil522]
MTKVGYARVSTADQTMDLQIDSLKASGCKRIFEEKVSGKKSDRPELARCLEYLRSGDTLVIWKLDRLGRTTKQLIELSHDLKERGISLQIITLGVDTSTPAGKLFFLLLWLAWLRLGKCYDSFWDRHGVVGLRQFYEKLSSRVIQTAILER